MNLLENIFFGILTASWQASVLVVFVIIAHLLLGRRLNPRWRYALWLLVVLRLVVPALPASAASFYQIFPASPMAFRPFTDPYVEKVFFPLRPVEVARPSAASNLEATLFRTRGNSGDASHVRSLLNAFLALAWLAGVISLLVLTWLVNHRFARQVSDSPAIFDPELLRLFAEARAELGLHRAVRLVENSQVQSPAIMGLFQPTLLLPADVREKFTAPELRFIFLHELAHLKRGDVIVQALIALLQILHWFNPVLWFAFRRMRLDREPATDALVLSRAGEQEKERYGLMLIKLLENFNQRHSLPTLVGILEDRDQFKRRFALIARFTRGAYGWSLLGAALLIALAAAGLTRANLNEITAPNSDAKFDFQMAGRSIPISPAAQESILHLLHELLVLRYVNGTPDDIFYWQSLPGTSAEQIRTSGSFLHIVYLKKPSIPVGTKYSYQPDEVWIGLQDGSTGESYPGYPAGIMVVTSGKDGTFNLSFGSKSLLVGIGLLPDIFPRLPPAMQKSLQANKSAYQHYLDWTSTKDAVGQPVNQHVITAVQQGDAATLQKLVAAGVDITKVKGRDPTLLFQAASPEVAELLIQHGTDVKVINAWGSTALDSVVMNSPSNAAAITRVLLDHGADPNRPSGELQTTPALEAYRGDTLDALVEHGADLKAIDGEGYGVLFCAGRHDVTYLQSLIRHGVVFDPKKDGPTIMVQAAWVNNLPVIKWLLDHGVDPSAQGLWVHNKNEKDDMMFPLETVVISGQFDAAKLLLDHGARWSRATALALQNHHNNIVKLLWDHGVRDISELSYAISQNANLDDLEKILQSGAPVDSPNDIIITPLGEAAEMDNLAVARLLVQDGADVSRGGSPVAEHAEYQDTPLVLAAQRGQDEIVTFLLQHGARANPNAVSGAANGGIPNSFYVGKDKLPSKGHYESVIQSLIDAGAVKSITPEWSGRILLQVMSPCWGSPDPSVLQKLLAAGLSPETPMPALAGTGGKPNSVIGYFRDYYQKNKDDPAHTELATTIKPLLDILEAADKEIAPKSGARTDATNSPAADAIVKAGPDPTAAEIPQRIPPGDVAVQLQVLQIGDDIYQAHRADIDAALQRGDAAFLSRFKSSDLISQPIDMQPPDKRHVFAVGDIAKQNFLLDFNVEARPDQGKIAVTGRLTASSIQGNIPFGANAVVPNVVSREINVYEQLVPGQTKALQATSIQGEIFPPAGSATAHARRRLFLLMTAWSGPPLPPTAFPNVRAPSPSSAPNPSGSLIQVELRMVEIPDDVYRHHQAEIDAGIEKGGPDIFQLFNQLPGVTMFSTPSGATKPGFKITIDIGRVFPYPTSFDSAKVGTNSLGHPVSIPPTPREFTTRDVGVSAEITPTIDDGNSADHGKIILNGSFKITDFDGFIKSNLTGVQMPSFSIRESLFIEELENRQIKGFWIPGARFDEQTVLDQTLGRKPVSSTRSVKHRLLLFVSANRTQG